MKIETSDLDITVSEASTFFEEFKNED